MENTTPPTYDYFRTHLPPIAFNFPLNNEMAEMGFSHSSLCNEA